MNLELLKNVEELDGFELVKRVGPTKANVLASDSSFVVYDEDLHSLTFILQKGPVLLRKWAGGVEARPNGCRIETMLAACMALIMDNKDKKAVNKLINQAFNAMKSKDDPVMDTGMPIDPISEDSKKKEEEVL